MIKNFLASLPYYYRVPSHQLAKLMLPHPYHDLFSPPIDPVGSKEERMRNYRRLVGLEMEEIRRLWDGGERGEGREISARELEVFGRHRNPDANDEAPGNKTTQGGMITDVGRELMLGFWGSRVRWLKSEKPLLSTKGLRVKGVKAQGRTGRTGTILEMGGVGVNVWDRIKDMSDYSETRVLSSSPISDVTVRANGEKAEGFDDDVFPACFFNRVTGGFADTKLSREAALVGVDFGNPHRQAGAFVGSMYEGSRPEGKGRKRSLEGGGGREEEGEGMVMMMGNKEGGEEERKSEDEEGEKRQRKATEEKQQSKTTTTQPAMTATSAPPPTPAVNNTSTQNQQIDLTDPNSKPNLQLPQGWIVAWSRSNKRWYFNHIPTKRSVWEYHLVK
ncbi:hypothetical protein TrCOL_g4054 [Triparma columacea]|uniref:WW domain-containing protein n=1 Tax=Triparma columacea TaxID=722753 RepID=A0A9W7LG01_9STRA|nr:hypothetical protein TrCOL_g4054 [Triparma columacea]